MKVKKLFGIPLLAGSLLLSSCEDLLSNLMGGGKKSKDNESGEKVAYQGKQGATELSKEEWELAFSLEELALRRNCHLEVTQEETQMKMDIDNGKFKIDVPYSSESVYFHFTDVDSSKMITGTYYYSNGNGGYDSGTDKEPLDLTMAEFGVIYLDYPNKNPEGVSMTAKIVANPKGSDKQRAELVKFRAEMIQKFGLQIVTHPELHTPFV